MIGLAMMLAASGSFVTGNQLYEDCTREKTQICLGYIVGVVDGYLALRTNPVICIPAKVTMGQINDIAVTYLTDHPEKRQYTADSLVLASLIQAFPCAK